MKNARSAFHNNDNDNNNKNKNKNRRNQANWCPTKEAAAFPFGRILNFNFSVQLLFSSCLVVATALKAIPSWADRKLEGKKR